MKVVLIHEEAPDGTLNWSLTVGRGYMVLGIEGDWFRLIDDRGEPVLFDPCCFEVVDSVEPASWVSQVGEGGERDAYPPGWGTLGFFEKWHDEDQGVRDRFAEEMTRWFPGVEVKVECPALPPFHPPPRD